MKMQSFKMDSINIFKITNLEKTMQLFQLLAHKVQEKALY